MTVLKDPSGRRSVQAEVEVPGTQDKVWRAVATGSGISSWFVPSQVEERVGGTATANFGPGMESAATITVWDPPRRFVAESQDLGPNAPTVITEWTVQPRSSGGCAVRVSHSLVTDGGDWDHALMGWAYGWPAFFRILKVYLTHFAGLSCSAMQLMGFSAKMAPDAWNDLTTSLGIQPAQVGQSCGTRPGAPPLSGIIEHATTGEHPELLIRLDVPATGIAHLFAMPMGGQVLLPIRLYLYGEMAGAVLAQEEALWQKWMAEHFPAST